MSSQVFGLTTSSLVPGPTLVISRDAEGKTTGTREFSTLKGALANPVIQAKLAKGVRITTLCPDVPADYAYLEIDSFESRDAPGGITTITVTFTGYSEDGEFGFDREITYSARGTTFRRPILEHPTFIADMEEAADEIREGFVAILSGEAYGKGTSASNYQIIRFTPNEEIIGTGGYVSNDTNNAWWDIIVKKGLKDYDAASFEWTRSATNAAGLTDEDIAKLAKADEPPGDPPTPEEEGWWQLMDLSDERSSNQSSNTLTWRYVYGEKIAKLYDYEDT